MVDGFRRDKAVIRRGSDVRSGGFESEGMGALRDETVHALRRLIVECLFRVMETGFESEGMDALRDQTVHYITASDG